MISDKINSIGQSISPLQSGQRGVTLIDAMIALVIFSIGMLAIAALQTVSKTSNFEAIQRSHGASLTYDLFERMRMNTGALLTYVPGGSVEYKYSDTLTTPSADCSVNACSSSDMANWDLYEFQQMLRGDNEKVGTKNMGGIVKPTVCITGPTNGQYTLTIVWRGQTKITNQNASTCGSEAGIGAYDNAAHDDFAYRRILSINTYL